jgi:hypothetical protein
MSRSEYSEVYIVRGEAYHPVYLHAAQPRTQYNPFEWKDTLVEIARTLELVPATRKIRHPVLAFEVDLPPQDLDTYWTEANENDIRIRPRWGVARTDATVHVYPAQESFSSLDAVLADITGFFAKKGIIGGQPQRISLPGGGTALVVEAPGTKTPYMVAVEREGRYFFVRASTEKAVSQSSLLWGHVRHAITTVRPARD